jgi:hypothetical protein
MNAGWQVKDSTTVTAASQIDEFNFTTLSTVSHRERRIKISHRLDLHG